MTITTLRFSGSTVRVSAKIIIENDCKAILYTNMRYDRLIYLLSSGLFINS